MKKKRVLSLLGSICLILVLVALLLPACAKAPAPAAPTPGTPTPTPTPAPAAPTPGTPTPAKPAPTVTVTVTPAPTPAQVFKWKWQTSSAPANPDWGGMIQVSDLIKKYSGGRLEITIYPAGAIASQIDVLDTVKGNTVQIGTGYGGYWKNFIPEGGIDTLPNVWRTTDERFALYYQYGLEDLFQEAFAEQGVYFWGPTASCARALIAKRPIRTLSDFKGLKLRAVGDMATLFTALGAAPAPLAHEETYMALQLGTIEGYDGTSSLFVTWKTYEVCKYFMEPSTNPVNGGGQIVSLKALAELPEDLATFVKAFSAAAGSIDTWRYREGDSFGRATLAKSGVQTIQMDKTITDVLAKASLDILDTYTTKSARCKKIIDIIKKYRSDKG